MALENVSSAMPEHLKNMLIEGGNHVSFFMDRFK